MDIQIRGNEVIVCSASRISTYSFATVADAKQWSAFYQSHDLMPYAFPDDVAKPIKSSIIPL